MEKFKGMKSNINIIDLACFHFLSWTEWKLGGGSGQLKLDMERRIVVIIKLSPLA